MRRVLALLALLLAAAAPARAQGVFCDSNTLFSCNLFGLSFDPASSALTFSGQLLAPAGSAALPAYSFLIDPSTGFRRSSLGVVTFDSQASDSVQFGAATTTGFTLLGGSGSNTQLLVISEVITLSTGAATTDSAANLLPANSVIEAVVWRVQTTITTAANYSIGDPTTAARFVNASTQLTAGLTGVGLLHMDGAVATSAAGPTQTAAAKIRITCNVTPGAGSLRVSVYYRIFTPPSS